MAMVDVGDRSLPVCGLTAWVGWLGLRVGGHPALSLHSSNEPDELLQWPWSWEQHHKHCRWLLLLLLKHWRKLKALNPTSGLALSFLIYYQTSEEGAMSIVSLHQLSDPTTISKYGIMWNIFFGWLVTIIKLLLQTQPTFLPWRFGLCQRPSSEEACSVLQFFFQFLPW